MLGWIFLAGGLGGLFYVLATNYAGLAALFGSATGFTIEPFTGTSLFTDWLTWALTDIAGLFMLFGMALFIVVIAGNSMSGSGDLAR